MTLQSEPAPEPFPAASYARHLCRLCLCSREQTARGRLAHIDWFRWPSAEITRLYERVVGEQLLVSEHISELHCDVCLAWLDGTLRRIDEFKRISGQWTEELERGGLLDGSSSLAEVADEPESELESELSMRIEAIKHEDEDVEELIILDPRAELVDEVGEAANGEVQDLIFDLQSEAVVTEVQQSFKIEYLSVADECSEDATPERIVSDCDDEGNGEYLDDEEEHLIEDEEEHRTEYEVDDGAEFLDAQFCCDHCDSSFTNRSTLFRHFLHDHGFVLDSTAHSSSPPKPKPAAATTKPKSKDANKRRDLSRSHRNNRLEKANRAPLHCDLCPSVYLRPTTLQRHYTSYHPEADWSSLQSRLCLVCFRQFRTDAEAAAHRSTVHQRWRCDLCHKLCMCAASLERHRRTHSDKQRPHRCPICGGTYVRLNQLKVHHLRKHTTERPFACDAEGCDKRYASRSELNVHLNSARHSEERWRCKECDQAFASEKYLGYHVAKVHTGEFRWFVCEVCREERGEQRRFVNTRLLNSHMAVHHPAVERMEDEDEQ